jgi:uncharacterized protein (TIGR00725 family)
VNTVLANHTVGVLGSGHDPHEALAADVGRLLAELEVNLLTGGGGGVMTAVSRAFVAARRGRGICIGILPCSDTDPSAPRDGYPNEFVDLPIFTHLPYSGERGTDPLSRNHINVLSCAALVALPGGAGTRSEVLLAVRYRKPVIAYGSGEFQDVSDLVPRAKSVDDVRGFLKGQLRGERGVRDG